MKKIADFLVILCGLFFCLFFFIPSFFPNWSMGNGFALIASLIYIVLPITVIAIVLEIIVWLKERGNETLKPSVQQNLSTKQRMIVFVVIVAIAYCVYLYVPWSN